MSIGNRGQTVTLRDQVTSPVNIYFADELTTPTLLTTPGVVNGKTVDVADSTGFVIGCRIGVFSGVTGDNRFFFAYVTNVVSNTIHFNEPLDFAFKVGSFAVCLDRRLNVDGSVTPRTFSVRGPGIGSPLSFEVTKIMVVMTTDNPIALNKFGDIPGDLANGLVFRVKNAEIHNIATIRSNLEFEAVMPPLKIYAATNPVFGIDGLSCIWEISGQENLGVAIELEPGDEFQAIVQDDLSSILDLAILAQGHVNFIGGP